MPAMKRLLCALCQHYALDSCPILPIGTSRAWQKLFENQESICKKKSPLYDYLKAPREFNA